MIKYICTNVQKKYGILRKIRRYMSEDTALLIYKVMIRPHFDLLLILVLSVKLISKKGSKKGLYVLLNTNIILINVRILIR